MKKLILLSAFLCWTLCSSGQTGSHADQMEGSRLYGSFEKYMNREFDVVPTLDLKWQDKPRRNNGDGDYAIKQHGNQTDIDIAKEMLLIEQPDSTLFINCTLIKSYAGRNFAAAIAVGDKVFFWAFPGSDNVPGTGTMIALGAGFGLIGGIIAASISTPASGPVPDKSAEREIMVYDPATKKARALSYEDFIGMLEPYNDLKEAYLNDTMDQCDIYKADGIIIWRYLGLLKQRCGADTAAVPVPAVQQ